MDKYKVDGVRVLWYNGQKWLIKETFNSSEEAVIACEALNS